MSTVTLAGINDFFIRLFFRENASSQVGSGLAGSDGLYLFIWWVSVFFFVLLMGLMFWFCWKSRRRPGAPAERSSSHNTALEVTWSVVPTLILVVIFFWGFNGYLRSQMPAGHAELIDLDAYKWGWGMTYDNGGQSVETVPMGASDVPVFYVPAGEPRAAPHVEPGCHSQLLGARLPDKARRHAKPLHAVPVHIGTARVG